MAEQRGDLAAGVMEALGSSLDLDPRFFQSGLRGSKRVLAPSEHHRAPFTTISFGVPKLSTPTRTDAEKFKVAFYVKPADVVWQMPTLQEGVQTHSLAGDAWTGWLYSFLNVCVPLNSCSVAYNAN